MPRATNRSTSATVCPTFNAAEPIGSASHAASRVTAARMHAAAVPAGGSHSASDDDWVPPPHAVPFGPFLALAALEQLLVGAFLTESWFGFMERLWGG